MIKLLLTIALNTAVVGWDIFQSEPDHQTIVPTLDGSKSEFDLSPGKPNMENETHVNEIKSIVHEDPLVDSPGFLNSFFGPDANPELFFQNLIE